MRLCLFVLLYVGLHNNVVQSMKKGFPKELVNAPSNSVVNTSLSIHISGIIEEEREICPCEVVVNNEGSLLLIPGLEYLYMWNIKEQKKEKVINYPRALRYGNGVFSSDDSLIALNFQEKVVRHKFLYSKKPLAYSHVLGKIFIWDCFKERYVKQFNHEELVLALAFNKLSTCLATITQQRDLYLWDFTKKGTAKIIITASSKESSVEKNLKTTTLAFSPDEKQLLANFNEVIKCWDIASGQLVKIIAFSGLQTIYSISPHWMLGKKAKNLCLFNISSKHELMKISTIPQRLCSHSLSPYCVSILSPNGEYLLTSNLHKKKNPAMNDVEAIGALALIKLV